MRESNLRKGCKHLEIHINRSNSLDFVFEKIIDFAMNIDKLDLAILEAEVLTRLWSSRFFRLQKITLKEQKTWFLALRK